jgi:hypothetical protein
MTSKIKVFDDIGRPTSIDLRTETNDGLRKVVQEVRKGILPFSISPITQSHLAYIQADAALAKKMLDILALLDVVIERLPK